MIVRQFLQWIRTAPSTERADATAALARAYLYSDLSDDDRAAAEGAMIMLLDDPAPMVRRALARVLAASEHAPPTVIHALATDLPDIAAYVLAHSPLFIDAELVDFVAIGNVDAQTAIADRPGLPCAVAAALAEVGRPQAVLALIRNPQASIASLSIDRIVERFGGLPVIREALLERDDLCASARHALMTQLSQALAAFVADRNWLTPERAGAVAREACERGTVALAARSRGGDLRGLIVHLRESGNLNAGLILRALLSGNSALFEESLADLADMPVHRVCAILHDSSAVGFRALYERAGLPASTYAAFREAVNALREAAHRDEPGNGSRLKRRMIERVLTRCGEQLPGEIEPFMTLLRRFATEAAREEARLYCDDLVADDLRYAIKAQYAA